MRLYIFEVNPKSWTKTFGVYYFMGWPLFYFISLSIFKLPGTFLTQQDFQLFNTVFGVSVIVLMIFIVFQTTELILRIVGAGVG